MIELDRRTVTFLATVIIASSIIITFVHAAYKADYRNKLQKCYSVEKSIEICKELLR